MEDAFFIYQQTRFHYLKWSAQNSLAEQPLVLLHGFAQSARSWETVARYFSHRNVCQDVYALDFVGHGETEFEQELKVKTNQKSHQGDRGQTLSFQANALLSFLDTLYQKCQKKVQVVGYSMGGRMALAALELNPQCFAQTVSVLVLESAHFGLVDASARESVARVNESRSHLLRTQGLSAFMDEWEQLALFDSQRLLPQSKQRELRQARMNNAAESLACSLEYAGAQNMPLQDDVLSAVRIAQEQGLKTWYFAGKKDEKYSAWAQALEQQGIMPVSFCPEAGHNIHFENPDWFNTELARALVMCSRK